MKDKLVITFEAHDVKSEVSMTDQSDLDEVMEVIKGHLIIMGYSYKSVFQDAEDL
jgi:hypothetical protein